MSYSLREDQNPERFSDLTESILELAGAVQYIPLFKEFDIGIADLCDFTEMDLTIIGVDCPDIKKKLLETIDNFTLKFHKIKYSKSDLSAENVSNIITGNSKQLHKITLSVMADRISLTKAKEINDVLLPYKYDFYTTNIIMNTAADMEKLLDRIENRLDRVKRLCEKGEIKRKRRKFAITATGSALIIFLSIGLYKSLKFT